MPSKTLHRLRPWSKESPLNYRLTAFKNKSVSHLLVVGLFFLHKNENRIFAFCSSYLMT